LCSEKAELEEDSDAEPSSSSSSPSWKVGFLCAFPFPFAFPDGVPFAFPFVCFETAGAADDDDGEVPAVKLLRRGRLLLLSAVEVIA
jgi:hypothetical protein